MQRDILHQHHVLPPQLRRQRRPGRALRRGGQPEGNAEAGAGLVAEEDLDEGQLGAPARGDGAGRRDGDDAGDEVHGHGLRGEAEQGGRLGDVFQVGEV
ncbi:hypothetical protein N0V92_013987, partial [Colletotrichum tropicale]